MPRYRITLRNFDPTYKWMEHINMVGANSFDEANELAKQFLERMTGTTDTEFEITEIRRIYNNNAPD